MNRLSQETAQRFPEVDLFFARAGTIGPDGKELRGIYRTRMIQADGLQMLCVSDSGAPFLLSLRGVVKVTPISTDRRNCQYDTQTGCIHCTDTATGERTSLGPIRGSGDPSINLRYTAQKLELDWDALKGAPTAQSTTAAPQKEEPKCTKPQTTSAPSTLDVDEWSDEDLDPDDGFDQTVDELYHPDE